MTGCPCWWKVRRPYAGGHGGRCTHRKARIPYTALEQNPHILGIENVEVERDGSALRIAATIETEYGEMETGV